MDHLVRQRLNEIRQRQLESHDTGQATGAVASGNDRSLYLAALGGIAAGLILAAIIWLVGSIWFSEDPAFSTAKPGGSIQADRIRETGAEIDALNSRIEVLMASINKLETRLVRTLELSQTIADVEIRYASAMLENSPTAAGNEAVSAAAAAGMPVPANELVPRFSPTHIVTERLNLRPSTSLDNEPITVLETGTGVSVIEQADGWFYVNTEQYGKGWCSARYLSPVSTTTPAAGDRGG